MKVLFFTYDFPYPTTSGGKTRAYNMLKFAGEDIQYILFSFYRDIPDKESIEAIEALRVERIHLFQRDFAGIGKNLTSTKKIIENIPKLVRITNPIGSVTKKLYYKKTIEEALIRTVEDEKIDIIHYESLYTAYFLSERIKTMGVRQVFGTENIEYEQYRDFAVKKAPRAFIPFYKMEARKIERDEKKLFKTADSIVAVSKSDADAIYAVSGREARIVENGVDLDFFSFKKRTANSSHKLLFVGNFTYFPNLDAITHFYNSIFPLIKTPHIELQIVGKNSTQLPFAHEGNVHAVEYIDDIRDAYNYASLFIFPVRIGGGTNFKLLEAMACGVPVVAYHAKAQSIGAMKDEHIFVAEDEINFANKIDYLLSNAKKADEVAKTARKFIEENYSWEVIGKKLNTVWKENV